MVLTADFFAPWLDAVRPVWTRLRGEDADAVRRREGGGPAGARRAGTSVGAGGRVGKAGGVVDVDGDRGVVRVLDD